MKKSATRPRIPMWLWRGLRRLKVCKLGTLRGIVCTPADPTCVGLLPACGRLAEAETGGGVAAAIWSRERLRRPAAASKGGQEERRCCRGLRGGALGRH